LLVLAAAWPWRQPHSLRLRLGWVLGLGAGLYAGCAVLGQWPRWPAPEDKDRYLVLLMPLVLAVEIIAALVPRPWWLSWLPRIGVAAAAAPILLYQSSYVTDLSGPGSAEWSSRQALLIFTGLAAALLAAWGLLALLSARTSERAAAPVLAVVLLAAAVAVMKSGYLIGGQLALPLAGALAGATLASFAAPARGDTSRYHGVGVVGLFTLLLTAHLFSYLPQWAAVCLFFVPLVAWLPDLLGPLRRWPSLREAARLSLVALPLLFIVPYAEKPRETPTTVPSEFEVTPDDYKSFGQ
jgi:hypothetical protein